MWTVVFAFLGFMALVPLLWDLIDDWVLSSPVRRERSAGDSE